ncbi:MAG: hypothetical protein PF572_03750 [Patescibacteria group bacterium]|jgi:hypothetical protein|nr:hypothetical protein [Patescibacteria group bacterium]
MPEKTIDEKLIPKIKGPEVDPFDVEKNTPRHEQISKTEDNYEKSAEDTSLISEKISENKKGNVSTLVQSTQSEREKKIESILEVDLANVYLKLSPEDKILFKIQGEKTAKAINLLIDNTKIKVKKILVLIKDWLKMIPGVNKFFIEQLAKSKLDEIMKLKRK